MRRAVARLVWLCALLAVARCAHSLERVEYESDVRPFVPAEWLFDGPALADEQVDLDFVLRPARLDDFERLLGALAFPPSPRYGRWLSDEAAGSLLATPKAAESVRSWLEIHSEAVVSVAPQRTSVRVQCPVRTAEEILHVTFHAYRHAAAGQRLLRAPTHYSLPKHIAPLVLLVGGVFRFPRVTHPLRSAGIGTPTTPQSIAKMYNITVPRVNATNVQSIASFLGQYFSLADLADFQAHFDLVPLKPLVFGPNNQSQIGIEASLDIQYLPGVSFDSIETNAWSTSGQTPHNNEPFLRWLLDVSAAPLNRTGFVVSISYQDYEETVSEAYATAINAEFMRNSARGITFVTGSGDWGVGCQAPSNSCAIFSADFPSSSPYVLSTGATTLSLAGDEVGVAFSSGGFSNYFARPAFQSVAVQEYLESATLPPPQFFNASGRAFPDVAAIGTNFVVFYGGQTISVGGTSAATPTFAAVLSMINSLRFNANLPPLGWVHPFLYAAAQSHPDVFNDISDSQPQDHGCCPSGFEPAPGWDPITGLGTPNFGLLAELALDTKYFNFDGH